MTGITEVFSLASLEFGNKMIFKKSPNINNTLLNNPWLFNELTIQIRKCFKLDGKIVAHRNWESTKTTFYKVKKKSNSVNIGIKEPKGK